MKKALFITAVAVGLFTSCDHVENPYPPTVSQGTWDLYPDGDSAHYYQNVYQTFTANTNTDRNVLIEDFTGHRCTFCPEAADTAEYTADQNPGRVFVEAIHTGPAGLGTFQELQSPNYTHDFTCTEGLTIGQYFGIDWPSSPFFGNPFGAVSRYDSGSGHPVQYHTSWDATTNTILGANDLKVNLQSQVNYYNSTRGLFVHIEADVLDAGLTNELKLVAHLIEDSLVAGQTMPDNSTNLGYVHKHVLVGSLDGSTWGQTLDAAHMDPNGKYYFNYIYELPSQYDPSNMTLIFYVRDAVTEEIYHVIEEHVN